MTQTSLAVRAVMCWGCTAALGAAVALVATGHERGWTVGMIATSGLFLYWVSTRGKTPARQ